MTNERRGRLLDTIEPIGNALSDPTNLFRIGAIAVIALSQLTAVGGWTVERTLSREVKVNQPGRASHAHPALGLAE